jgi:hypothetical protein
MQALQGLVVHREAISIRRDNHPIGVVGLLDKVQILHTDRQREHPVNLNNEAKQPAGVLDELFGIGVDGEREEEQTDNPVDKEEPAEDG